MKTLIPRWKNYICILLAMVLATSLCPIPVHAAEFWPEGPDIDSPYAIVMEINSGTILYEKESDVANYPASITKIMTTLLALENCELNEVVTFSKAAIDNTPRDSSHIWRDIGEEMTMEECLYAIMLESANECAYAVAEHVGQKLGGDYQTFIDLMNERAKELGCTNTNFANPSGLPDKTHKASSKDMALIAAEAYRNETFRIITSTKRYQIPPTNKHTDITYLLNHHKMLHRYKDSNYVYEYCTGGKTGHTTVAKYTLVTYAEKDGLSLVCVVMRTTSKAEWTDTRELFDYCFQNFKPFRISEYDTAIKENDKNLGVLNSYDPYIELDTNAYVVLPATVDFADVKSTLEDVEGTGSVIARLQYSYAGRPVGCVDIKSSGAKVEEDYFDYAKEEQEEPDKNIVKIKPLSIIAVVLAVFVVLVIIIFCKRLYDNYYVILHNMEVKRQRKERFRPISVKKKKWKRRDRMFW